MPCESYRKYWLGELSEEVFATHRCNCAECRRALTRDAELEAAARELPVPTEAPGLWRRIAAELADAEQAPVLVLPERPRWWSLARRRNWAVAAVLLFAVGLTAWLQLRPQAADPLPRNVLTAQALDRVEAAEAQYVAAITDLAELAAPLLAAATGEVPTIAADSQAAPSPQIATSRNDRELLLRYRERLAIIDTQIARCQAVLARDSANAHVRQYLLAAYQDKRETLTELLRLQRG